MITLLTGDNLRHKYLVDCFSKIFDDLIWIIQKREKFIPSIDKNFNTEIKKLQKTHFEKLFSVRLTYASFALGAR